ncbi:Bifunctional phosphoribosylaminoimidazolecarboxamide formyltransferase/IMP cyclohydrolase [Bibersteinia trehalosi USDA-ARS-USMARC-189]|uniref:Bifunctional phosphoribosylaminoimidazolecarboxamide formyltransferase/IMP cyclohydrolase n=1 Tax=Bibersteinia trehalosi USDA-ARS-USMARC-189 TaxID=1263831 RepID=A0ABM5PH77_BIBTR|nr:DoxX family protein [Bibersteinia trehalosi]AGH37412.1 Bifunctional phosphoribosylaminoimidazolecarboxamide formyltransferase/IMP cyclohydrolase [Bibersteinia trehalosi USDA-ARS-USMARC-192]AHG85115.1 Bifunctional phosphoribosylaminoimidazolecarboxamide formyltransferase/IMP cyclohydrolase [Bibersteinia trehalosi USDA-ARS-USMARC-189]
MTFLQKLQPQILAFVRILTGYAFLLHGTAKFFEFPFSMTNGNGSVQLMSIFGLAGILELMGGVLIILGLFTRVTAFILSGQMAIAYFMFHFSFLPLTNGGEPAMLFSLVFLMLAAFGGGAWSLDNRFTQNK